MKYCWFVTKEHNLLYNLIEDPNWGCGLVGKLPQSKSERQLTNYTLCIYIYIYTRMTCVYICVCIYTCVCIYIYIYIYIYISMNCCGCFINQNLSRTRTGAAASWGSSRASPRPARRPRRSEKNSAICLLPEIPMRGFPARTESIER